MICTGNVFFSPFRGPHNVGVHLDQLLWHLLSLRQWLQYISSTTSHSLHLGLQPNGCLAVGVCL